MVAAPLMAAVPKGAYAQSQETAEYNIKAAFLYNFAKFVEWPAKRPAHRLWTVDDPLCICVVGEDPFGRVLEDTIQGKNIGSHKVVIERLKQGRDMNSCQIAFISSSEKNHLRSILESLKGGGVLTVGDTEGFAQAGVAINFILEENKVHFEINVDAADRAGLKISSKLLSLARIVQE